MSESSAGTSAILPPLSERNYWPPESAQLRTKLADICVSAARLSKDE